PEHVAFFLDDDPLALDHANPAVFRALTEEMLFLANQGIEVLRTDAAGAHLLRQAFFAVLALAAPGVALAAEVIAPSGGALDAGELRLAYDSAHMALTWDALATGDPRLLQHALEHRPALPDGTVWVNYVRSHDHIAWTFDDADAAHLGIDAAERRMLLTDFYTGGPEHSFARGVPLDPARADGPVAGTTASLAGVETGDAAGEQRVLLAHAIALSTGGVPLLYLGDEVAQLNDYTYTDDPARRDDPRWVHRGNRPRDRYAQRADAGTPAGRVHRALTKLIAVRQATPEL